jgi:hypothetical protein
MVHETLSNERKLKIMQSPHIKPPPFSYGNGFSPKRRHYYAFIIKKM